MKGLKNFGAFFIVAAFVLALSLAVMASTASNFTKGDIPASYFSASQHNLVLNVTLPDNGGAPDEATSIIFSNNGTAMDTDIKLRVWNDTDSNGIFDRFVDKEIGPSPIGIPALSASQWNFSNGFTIPSGGARIFVTADTLTPTSGRTLQIGIPQNGVYVASNNDGPTDAAVVNVFTQTIDIIFPSLTAVSISPASPVKTNTLLNATCTDASPLTVTYNINSAANISLSQTGGSFTGTIDISSVSDGSHTINVFCADAANNTDTSGLSFTVDKTSPAVSIVPGFSTTINNTASTENLSFTGSFSDGTTNLQSGDYALDGGAPVSLPALNGSYGNDMNLNYSFLLSSLSDGQHTVSVRAFDTPGNVGSISYTFFVDTEVPISSVNLTSSYKTTRVFQLPYSSNDSVQTSGIQNVTLYYRINQSGGFVPYVNTTNGTFTFDATLLGDGFYEFYTVARDNAGNIEAAPSSADANTTVDTVMPSITSLATTDTPEFINGTDIWFRLSAHSSLSFNATANDTTSGIQTCTSIFNSTTASISGSGGGYNSTAVFGFSFSGITATNDSVVNVTAVCTDKAGLENRSSIIIMLDKTAPIITMMTWNETSNYMHVNSTGALIYSSMMPSGQTVAARGNSTESGSGFRNVTFSQAFTSYDSHSNSSSWESNYTINPADNGNGTINITVFDNVGNTLSTTLLAYAEDNAPPAITLTAPNGGELLAGGSLFAITWTPATDDTGIATNNITIEYSTGSSWTLVAGELPNSGSYMWNVPSINSNSVVIRVNASDVVQNIGSDSSNTVFTIDSTPPSIISSFTNDTNANGKIDRIELQFSEAVNVTSASGVAVAGYPITGTYVIFNTTQLSINLTEDGFDTNATPLVSITSPTIRDLSGNPLLQNLTPSDRARPILLAAKTNDTNLNGKIDVLILNFSEPVNNGFNLISANESFLISGYMPVSFISPTSVFKNNTEVLNVTPTSTMILHLRLTEGSSFDTASTPLVAALAGALADMSSNSLVPFSANAADGAPPFMANATTHDISGNGKIDNITVMFTESLMFNTINSNGGDFSLLPSYTILDVNKTGFAAGVLVLSLSEKSYFDSNETPIVSFVPGQTLRDSNGNNMTLSFVVPGDGVKPVITVNLPLNITYNITSNVTVNATFSEPVDVCKAEMNGANSTFACNTNTSVDLVEGNNTIRIWSNDTSGNINSAFVTLSFNPHSLPSVTTLSLPAFVNVTTQITVSTVINFTTAYVGNLSFIWYKNGAFSTNNTLLGVQNNTLITNTYNDTFTHFDMITVEVRPYKTSKGFGDFVNASVTAANTPPTTGIPAITPTEAYTNTTISCTPQNSADADNDTVTTTYAWIKNGVVIGGQTSSTLDGAAQFQRGDVITCQVTPNDGFASGNATNSSAATVLDSPPTMPTFVTSDITKANSSYSAFTFTAGGSVDNDTDTITYQYEANHTGSFVNIGNSTGSITWNITNLTSGFFSIRARANTTINNSAYLTNQTIFEIDTTKVAFTNPTPLNNTYINTSVLTINATVIMPDLTRVYANVSGTIINMTNSTPSVFSTSITLEDGMYSYFVTAESLSGANTTEVRVVHVDTLTPAISSVEIVSDKPNNLVRSGSATYIISSLPGIGGGQNLTFTINASDASTLTVKLVNGTQTFSDSTAPYTFILHINMSSISETRNLSINVTDAAGNSNRTDIELVFDNTPPATTHSLNDSSDLLHLSSPVIYFGGVVSEQLVVNGTSSDASSLGTFFSASPYTNVSTFSALTGLWSVTYILNNTSSNGTVSINITDLLGNPASIQLNIAKDAASPSAPAILQMPSLTTIIPNLIWTPATDTGSGIRGYMVMRSNDNATYTNVSSMLTATSFNDTSSPEGLVYYKIMAFDNVNNTNVSGTTNTSVDLFAPLVASVNATKINAAGTVVNITANITDVAGVNDATVSATLMNQSGGVVYVTNMTKVSELYNFTWNTTGLAEGLYYVQINASDVLSRTRSINKALVIVLTGSSTTTPQSVFTNSSVTTAANTTNSVNTSVGLALDLVTNSSATGSINVLSYNTNPVGSASGVTSLLALNKYFDIILSDNLNSTLSNATIKISYTDAEVSGIDESSLKIYLWTGSTWQAQPSTVDTAANIVSATVPHFSIYSTFGSAPAPAPPAPSVSGGGGGGGGFSACTENWACTSYSACSAGGLQKRTCVDKNRCGSVRSKPAETQLCVYTPTPACGNGIVETGEECDSVPQACTTDDGYVGKQACSTTCRAGICIPFEKCGDGVCNGPETSSTCSADCKAGETGGIETPTGMAISEAADPLLSAILIIGAIIIVFTAWRIMRNRRAAERPIRKKR